MPIKAIVAVAAPTTATKMDRVSLHGGTRTARTVRATVIKASATNTAVDFVRAEMGLALPKSFCSMCALPTNRAWG
jgi:hypothetical protein